jgi:membrane fusion protein (multidrug efflux system)
MDAITSPETLQQEIAQTVEPRTATQTEKPRFRPTRRTLLASGIAILIAVSGGLWITAPASSASTDDAYIGADATSVAPKVRGLIASIYVTENQQVRAGQPLVSIDPEEFDAKVAGAQAKLADALAAVAQARAALVSLAAEQRLAAANVVAARTSIRSANAESTRAVADRGRYAALVATGAVARSQSDSIGAAAVTAEQDAARAGALLLVSRETAGVTSAKQAGLLAAVQTAQAQVAQAQADLDLARQDRRHTTILAPIDGVVGNRQARVGDYVQPGTRMLTLVPMHALYVTANFKETQTARMRAGQRAIIYADAAPGVDIRGSVESFAPGSGSSFSLLPFEPGTGNFTKIVQRVPVRIRIDPGQSAMEHLRPGLSVTADVSLKGN